MEDPELIAICEALIDADPTMSGYHESHIAVKMPYALAVQKRLRSLTTWQPIETAPKDGRVILGYFTAEYVETITFRGGGWVWSHDGDTWTVTWPTHWMPLPTAPEADA